MSIFVWLVPENIRNLDDADLAYICDAHVLPDTMTIEHTFDVREK